MIPPATHVEIWIARRLEEPDLFAGVTTAEERRERVRALIERRELHLAIAGRSQSGKAETWTDLFRRVYGETVSREPNPRRSA